MVITDTGAASAVVKVLPELKGRLTANAIRVPTPNVSLAILNLNLEREVGTEEINTYLRDISLDVPLGGQIDYTSSPEVVSSDFVGNEKAGIVDSGATITQGNAACCTCGTTTSHGYSAQVIRILQHISVSNCPIFPSNPIARTDLYARKARSQIPSRRHWLRTGWHQPGPGL